MIVGYRDGTVGARATKPGNYRAHESKALAWNRSDKLLVGTSIANRLARGIDAAGQRRIRDNSPTPDLVNQVILADHSIAILEQKYQEVEDLGLDGDAPPAAAQLAQICIKCMIGKEKLHTQL